MTPSPFHAAPAPADACAEAGLAHGHAFIDRARQMVAFLAQRDGSSAAPQPEEELADWISRWRGMPRRGLDATQHFVAEELGIIVRALNGPPEGTRLRPERTDELCWLIARCISRCP